MQLDATGQSHGSQKQKVKNDLISGVSGVCFQNPLPGVTTQF